MRQITYIKYLFVLLGVTAFIFSSCKKNEWEPELDGEAPRLFRPVQKGTMEALGNYIEIAWYQNTQTNKYNVELSVDSFKTVSKSVEVIDTTAISIPDLLWDSLYQVRVIAVHPVDPAKNSRPADFGQFKTPRFPTIVESPVSSDVSRTSILFKWRNEGNPVTEVRLVNPVDDAIISTTPLTAADITNAYVLIEGLTPATSYRIELYSGTEFRGENTYTTKEQLSGVVVDLQGFAPSDVNLKTIVDTISAGGTIVLKRGANYEPASAPSFSKSITIMSGDDPLVPEKAKIGMVAVSNFGVAANANIAALTFIDLELYTNDAAGKYLFNPSGITANIEEMIFDNCIIHDMRGTARFRNDITVGQITINNSIVYNVGGYGVITVDDAIAKVNNFTFTNSTLYNADKLFTSKNNSSGKVIINSSTFYNAILSANFIIDYTSTSLGAAGGIDFMNVVLGRAKGTNATPPVYDIKGIRANPTTLVTSSNNFTTSDFTWRSDAAALMPETTPYTKTSADIFTDVDNADFTIKDGGFPGKATAGDPRWRP